MARLILRSPCHGTVIAGLISPQGMATLPLQFLLWINLPPFMAQPINGVWWTLPVELGFYLLLPLVGLLLRYVSRHVSQQ